MKIAHLCLSNFYIDGWSYQENELVREHVNQGHDVLVIASTENMDKNGKITYDQPGEYLGREGARIIRLAYRRFGPHKLMRKLRIHPDVLKHLEAFKPDTILFHGACGWELLTVAQYKRANPETLLYIDSHADENNSARAFISREVLHKLYYGPILRRALPHAEKILCISLDTMDFVESTYKIPRNRLEFYPLAGHPIPVSTYTNIRNTTRSSLGLTDENVMFIQSGKQTHRKKIIESLETFIKTPAPNFKFFIAGVLFDEIRNEAQELINSDDRITFIGWQTAEQLSDLLAAADIYLQPGTQSVTLQSSMCAHCAVIADDVKSHEPFVKENGWLINETTPLDKIFQEVSKNKHQLSHMQNLSYEIAVDLLDYTKLAKRILA